MTGNPFISPRRIRPLRGGAYKPRNGEDWEQKPILAKHNQLCPSCKKMIVEGVDYIRKVFGTRPAVWVHAGECLEKAIAERNNNK